MRIIQILPFLTIGDAIGNHTLALHRMFLEKGYHSEIYAVAIHEKLRKEHIFSVDQLQNPDREDLCLFHASTGSGALLPRLASLPCTRIMIYHNITPGGFFHPYSAMAEFNADRGYHEIRQVIRSNLFDACICDSEYNQRCLLEMGFRSPIEVCPLLIPLEDYKQKPEPRILQTWGDPQITNWIFVGRIAPNKCHEDIIHSFYYFHRFLNQQSRLTLVGNDSGMERYHRRLTDYVTALNLSDSVHFTGHVSFPEILAWYTLADAFVCMSEHEGFCVPLLEAMAFHVPVFAYASSAVPETLNGSGVLFRQKDPAACAGIIHQTLSDQGKRDQIVAGQDRRLQDFQPSAVGERFLSLLRPYAMLA